MPELAPYVDELTSWTSRRQMYVELLAKPDTKLVLASLGGELCGYGLAHVLDAQATWIDDTWVTGPQVGEIESLAVSPAYRGGGVGTSMLSYLQEQLEQAGVTDFIVGALPGNAGAIRLYQRHGFRPTWTYLSRFARPGKA